MKDHCKIDSKHEQHKSVPMKAVWTPKHFKGIANGIKKQNEGIMVQ
jgi:hypothetical protein